MFLRETLVDLDIPRHDKMRESIVTHWQHTFDSLKQELVVSFDHLLCSHY